MGLFLVERISINPPMSTRLIVYLVNSYRDWTFISTHLLLLLLIQDTEGRVILTLDVVIKLSYICKKIHSLFKCHCKSP